MLRLMYLDLGTVLTTGKNVISIKVCTDLTNRINNGEVKAGGGFGPVQQEPQLSASGLTDASINFYTVE